MAHEGYYRYPSISGNSIAFVCEDDIFLVDSAGGRANRLTNCSGPCQYPRFSPDGKTIAFVSLDEGHPEVFVMPASGGELKRLTYMGGDICVLSGWSKDSRQVNFFSDARSPFFRHADAYSVSIEGGLPKPRNIGHGYALSFAADGKRSVLGRNALDAATWKRYRGGRAGEIWIDRSGNGTFSPLIKIPGNCVQPMWIGERIYFVCDHEGIANIYSCNIAGKDLRTHTNHMEYFVRFPSTDGKRIVYCLGADIYLLDLSTNKTKKINIEAPSQAAQTARRFVHAQEFLEHVSVHPRGHAIGLIARGQPLSMAFFDGPVVQFGEGSKVRYRHFEWLQDGESFAVVSDRQKFERVEIYKSDDSSKAVYATKSDIGRVIEMKPSPVAKKLALANHRHELYILDVEKKSTKKIDSSPSDRISGLSWSADGRWLAYSWSPHQDARIIRLFDLSKGTIHDITQPLRSDYSPSFDPDGQYLYFLSNRDFFPVYDAQQFELSFPAATRPYLVTLRKDVPSPFAHKANPIVKSSPKDPGKAEYDISAQVSADLYCKDAGFPQAVTAKTTKSKTRNQKTAGSGSANLKETKQNTEEKKVKPIEIDFEDISTRVLAFPVEEGRYFQVEGARGRALFTRFPVKGIRPGTSIFNEPEERGVLYAYDFEERKSAVIQTNVENFVLGFDRQTLVYSCGYDLRVLDALQPLSKGSSYPNFDSSGKASGWMDLARAQVLIEPKDEWKQMYTEAWRLQSEHFWDPQMSMIDWDLVFERYLAILPKVRTRAELSDLLWEMQGELGTSHAYEIGGDYKPSKGYYKGFLGCDLSYDTASGGYRLDKILRGDSWNPSTDSPLAEPGLNVEIGEIIVAVDGRKTSKDLTIDELLLKSTGKHVQLTLKKKDKLRNLVVQTIRTERGLRYREWVAANRAIVHKQSGGKIGYVHIPDMGPSGFAEFHRSYLSEVHRQGLIVDARYNGGGHVSALLLEKLARKRIGYDVSRWSQPMAYPTESIAGPLVAITNQFAGSDGDIFSHCFKIYKLGPLVGKRTWGGVIGIWPRHRLVDGTITTQPEFSFWFQDVGWNVENYGTDPDYDVDYTPQDYHEGRDPQLAKGIELAIQALKAKPPKLPDFSLRPVLSLPGKRRR